MCDLCEFNDLLIGGTIFQHKLIHKLTWKSPDDKTESQIDHILINGKWRRSLQDVRTKRHADTGCDQPCGSCLGSEAENCQARGEKTEALQCCKID